MPTPARCCVALSLLLAASCSSPAWDREVQVWGTLREVMGDGDTEGKVAPAEVAGGDAVGLGALAGLEGEIAVVDGRIWIARVEDGVARTSVGAAPGDRAALLVLARVPAWKERTLRRDVDLEQLAGLLLQWAAASGLADADAFPFVVRGELAGLEAHVVAGACPLAGEVTPGTEPARTAVLRGPGTLVGFHSSLGPGVITHGGSSLHVHVVLEDEPYTGHVDAVRLLAGARVSLPRGR